MILHLKDGENEEGSGQPMSNLPLSRFCQNLVTSDSAFSIFFFFFLALCAESSPAPARDDKHIFLWFSLFGFLKNRIFPLRSPDYNSPSLSVPHEKRRNEDLILCYLNLKEQHTQEISLIFHTHHFFSSLFFFFIFTLTSPPTLCQLQPIIFFAIVQAQASCQSGGWTVGEQ